MANYALSWTGMMTRSTENQRRYCDLLALANPVQPSITCSAFHHEFAIIRNLAVAVDSANPCLNFTLSSNLGELCWLFQKDGDVFTCKSLNQRGPHSTLLEGKRCRIFPFAQRAAYAMAKRLQSFPPFCCSTSATSIMMLLDLDDINSHTAFSTLQSYRIFLFVHVEGMWTIVNNSSICCTAQGE